VIGEVVKHILIFWICAFASLLGEFGCALVLFNGNPYAPVGQRLWFGGLAFAFPFYVFWMYRQTIGRKH
jgi:hypothetical protein